MTNIDTGNYNPLAWVQDEVQQALAQALDAVNHYIEAEQDTHISTCIDELYQVNGTLEMLNLSGAMLLSKEMLNLAIMLREQKCKDVEQAHEVLIRTLIILPNYLQSVENGLKDHPLCILDSINEIKQVSQQPLINPLDVFKPTLSVHLPGHIAPDPIKQSATLNITNNKINHAFQISLLHWFKNEDSESLAKMGIIIHYLRLSCGQERSVILWWAAEAVIEALLDKSLLTTAEIKLTLGKLSPPIKLLTENSEEQLLALFPVDLVKKLLLIAARSSGSGRYISSLKKTFTLDLFDHNKKNSSMGNKALSDVRSALLEQLQEVKEHVNQYDRSSIEEPSDSIDLVIEQIQAIADTLQLLEEYPASEILHQQNMQLNDAVKTGQHLDENQLMALANSLMQVETILQSPYSNIEQKQNQEQIEQTVIGECLLELINIKESLARTAKDPSSNQTELHEIASQLQLISGSLDMLNHDAAAKLLSDTAIKIAGLSRENTLKPEHFNVLAEILAGGELYMEGVSQYGQPVTQLLDDAYIKLLKLPDIRRSESVNVDIDDTGNIEPEIILTKIETGVQRYINAQIKPSSASHHEKTGVERYLDNQLELDADNSGETGVQHYINAQIKLETSNAEKTGVDDQLELDSHRSVETGVQRYINIQSESSAPPFSEGIDPEIAEIFIEEANEVLTDFETLIPAWREQQSEESLISIRRHFHTLKGSGRMAGAEIIGDLALTLENLLNDLLESESNHSSVIEQIVNDTAKILPELLSNFTHGDMGSTTQVESLISRSNQVFNSEDDLAEQDELQAIFNAEATQHIAVLKQSFAEFENGLTVNKEMLRAIHSLKGCANIAEVTPVALVATQLDQILRDLHQQNITLSENQVTLLSDTVNALNDIVIGRQSNNFEEPNIQGLLENFDKIAPKAVAENEPSQLALDPEFLVVFLEETDELLAQYTEKLAQFEQQPDDIDTRSAISETLISLKDNAQLADLSNIAEIYNLLNDLTQTTSVYDKSLFELLEHGYEELNNHIEALIQNKPSPDISQFEQQVASFLNQEADVEINPNAFTIPITDLDLLDAFTEEAAELLESSGIAIKQWQKKPTDNNAEMQLQRDLHTLKGGARLTDITPIADLTHQIEALVLSTSDKQQVDDAFFDLLQRCQDRLTEMQEQLSGRLTIDFAHDLLSEISHFSNDIEPSPPEKEEAKPALIAETVAIKKESELLPPIALEPQAQTTVPAHVDQIRVRADLLDYLTNFAGEVSISRDRVTQQNIELHLQLHEMEETVERLQAQLRNLEIETEAQILFRHEDEVIHQESEFDPLELDRFSMIQQLSRGLTESVSDLNDITRSMGSLVKDTDSILLQQSRLNTDLHQGLMNTRLLPFDGLVPRLERIVRQTNAELGKKSELVVLGAHHEIDRTVLDRIVAPIEHLLRNAVDHGIEPAKKRTKLGKDETGKLILSISREGSEIIITLQDDGQGINVEKIKQKALDLKLITAKDKLSDDELTQLIFSSGFSTADKVSQISGRGVGMDVVSNEIRALKGRLSIQSDAGKGSTFIIRLPLTLSVTQALLIGSHEQQFAIPLANVYASERIKVEDLKAILSEPEAQYEYNGEFYKLNPLSLLLGQPFNVPSNNIQQLPVLLFRSGKLRIALVVDEVISNREIVIKAVGKQLSQISIINGATILGDGQVVFILDIPTLVETAAQISSQDINDANDLIIQEPQDRKPVAMVVDDSITMRKASGNLLRRRGFEVITARDGIEAVAMLNDQAPDLILLDVEMPRMDGFEFASFVRNEEQFKRLPIIMITSRTGDKHRDRAFSLGVNAYMGKPYQENELVDTMKDLLGDKYPHAQQ